MLADGDARAGLVGDGMLAGWDNRYFLASADGRFRLEIDGLLQFRWMLSHRQGSTLEEAAAQPGPTDRVVSGFESTRARVTLRGHLFSPEVEYLWRAGSERTDPTNLTSADASFGVTVLDAWFRLPLSNRWSMRVGQFKLPFLREALVASEKQLAVERSLVNSRLSLERSMGLEMAWTGPRSRVNVAFSDGSSHLLSFSGADFSQPPWSSLAADAAWAVTARYERLMAGDWGQFNQFTSPPGDPFAIMVGAAVHKQTRRDPIDGGSSFSSLPRSLGFTADFSAAWGGASLFAAGVFHQQNHFGGLQEIGWWGTVVQGGLYVNPRTEVFARLEIAGINRDPTGQTRAELDLVTIGLNRYLDGQDVKFTTDVGWAVGKVNGLWAFDQAGWRLTNSPKDEVVVRSQFQMVF